MAWIVTTSQMSSNYGLKMEHCGQETGRNDLGIEIALHPGVTVNMRAAIPGSFGIRHTPKIAGCGGSTVFIISDSALRYKDIDNHADTIDACHHRKQS